MRISTEIPAIVHTETRSWFRPDIFPKTSQAFPLKITLKIHNGFSRNLLRNIFTIDFYRNSLRNASWDFSEAHPFKCFSRYSYRNSETRPQIDSEKLLENSARIILKDFFRNYPRNSSTCFSRYSNKGFPWSFTSYFSIKFFKNSSWDFFKNITLGFNRIFP